MASGARPGIALGGARRVGLAAGIALAACTRAPARGPEGAVAAADAADAAGRAVRISLATRPDASVSASGAWRLDDESGRAVVRGGGGDRVVVTSDGRRLVVTDPRADGGDRHATLVLRAEAGAFVTFGGRRYRGALVLVAEDAGVRVVNRVALEEYLRGVVALEIGRRSRAERAAVEAQAVAARSFALARRRGPTQTYDLTASTAHQVYGGVDAETPLTDEAVAATAGLALFYDGRVVSAPYHSTCGGSTAEPAEVWRSRGEPFLRRVSDRIAGTNRYYCDAAPRFRWDRSWSGDTLIGVLERYLRAYANVPPGTIGEVRAATVEARTPSGRAGSLAIETQRGTYRVRGDEIRYVLRSAGGEMLNSTYFFAEPLTDGSGRLVRLTLRGVGYGHGVGMCQWGAIGRARAGQDFRAILLTYYPGTTVGRAY